MFSTNRRTAGVLVAPPTKSTWSKGLPVFRLFLDGFLLRLSACSASRLIPALSAAFSTGRRRSRRISEHTFSSSGRVSVLVEPPGIGTTTSVASLSFSRARLAACSAPRGSTVAPSALASFESHRATARSRSSPPRCASPPVARTSTAPPPTSSTETSNVPPPRSNTKTVSSPCTSTPYASAAAIGSRSSFTVSNPALSPARIVASHWPSSKYAGTAITALVTPSPPSAAEASATQRATIAALISSGLTFLPSAGHRTATNPAPFFEGPSPARPNASASASTVAQTSYGTRRASSATFLSLKRLPMNRFTEWNVFCGSLVRRFAAACPTVTEPSAAKCTTLGIVRRPFSSGTSTGRPSITTATQLLVVPRSMPQMEA